MSRSNYQPFVWTALVALVVIGLAVPLQGHGQVVRGEVIDEATEEPIVAVDVAVLAEDDEVLRRVTSDGNGRFILGTQDPGEYRLRAERLGYETVITDPLQLQRDSVVEVVIRLSSDVIVLEPLEVVGRGESEINRATFEGLYQRRARSPSVGTTRIWVRSDRRMDDLLSVREFLRLYHPTLRCPVFLIRGTNIPGHFIEHWLSTPVYELEGLEVYRRYNEAPPALRPVDPPSGRCGAVVIWPRRMGDEPW